MSPSKAQANKVERTPTTNDIFLFKSPATWTGKSRHTTKIYEQWQGPLKKSRLNNLVEVGQWVMTLIYKASKLALYILQYKL